MPQQIASIAVTLALSSLGIASPALADTFPDGVRDTLGPRFSTAPTFQSPAASRSTGPELRNATAALLRLRHWNRIAVDASGLDHTPVAPGEDRVFGHQLGPGRASRAMAIVHIAILDAINSIVGGYRSYTSIHDAPAGTSMDGAIAQAAHDTLVALFPSHVAGFDAKLAEDLSQIRVRNRRDLENGIRLGRRTAAAILARRADDGSEHDEPRLGLDYATSDAPGKWRQDPVSQSPLAMGARWSEVRPFVLRSASQFRVPAPPALDSAEYAAAFDEVKRLGGDGLVTPTQRSDDQTQAGIFWAYDGTPSLCAPPRLYNQIAVQIAGQMGSDVVETARLLALANIAMADAGVAIWESKYYYEYWRPVTGVREVDALFTPLGAPASNLHGPNFTPPFPAYPSGHAGFGGALFQTLRNFYGTDAIPFTFVSDEFNGVTLDHDGSPRPLLPRSFASLSAAEEENGQSRIYLGIHWSFDKTAGIEQGRRIADAVFRRAFPPVRR